MIGEGRHIEDSPGRSERAAASPQQTDVASKVGTLPQTLYDEAKAQRWTVISMKNDWKQIFAGPAK